MRQRIPLETYSRRTDRLYRRRSGVRRYAIVAASALALLGLVGVGYALTRPAPVASASASSQQATTPSKSPLTASKRVREPAAAPAPVATTATQTAAAAPAQPATLTIAGVGDMIFDRNVKVLVRSSGGEAPLADVAKRLAAADVAVGNLESALSDGGKENAAKDVTFRGHPDGIAGLKLAGFDFLSLANNHVLDYGPTPLADTVAALDTAGISHAGAGKDQDAAWKPGVVERNGAKVAYLAYSHIAPAGFIAQPGRPGMASGKMDPERVVRAVREAAKTNDYVIVSFHWGVEYEDNANAEQRKWAHRVIDAGADMVLSHHPHVIQGIEFYGGKMIAYSLGDFVFDHYSRKTGEAFILEAELGPDGTPSAVAVPVYLDGHGKPEYVTGAHAKEILGRLAKISKTYGTTVTIDGDVARITP